jgi:hypothetical protein
MLDVDLTQKDDTMPFYGISLWPNELSTCIPKLQVMLDMGGQEISSSGGGEGKGPRSYALVEFKEFLSILN